MKRQLNAAPLGQGAQTRAALVTSPKVKPKQVASSPSLTNGGSMLKTDFEALKQCPFPNILFVGAGYLGAATALSLRKQFGDGIEITMSDTYAKSLNDCEQAKIANNTIKINNQELSLKSGQPIKHDLLILATPVNFMLSSFNLHQNLLADNAVITDVGSTKQLLSKQFEASIAQINQENTKKYEYIPGHPIAGSNLNGAQAAINDAKESNLFAGANWIIGTQTDNAIKLAQMLASIGAKPVYMQAQLHDEVFSLTSHVPHAIAFAFSAVAQLNLNHQAQRNMYKTILRIGGSSQSMWQPIFTQNQFVKSDIAQINCDLNTLLNELKQKNINIDLLGHFSGIQQQAKSIHGNQFLLTQENFNLLPKNDPTFIALALISYSFVKTAIELNKNKENIALSFVGAGFKSITQLVCLLSVEELNSLYKNLDAKQKEQMQTILSTFISNLACFQDFSGNLEDAQTQEQCKKALEIIKSANSALEIISSE